MSSNPQESSQPQPTVNPEEERLIRARELASRKRYGLAFNTKPGEPMYALSRDFAYNYPQMISMIIRCFNQEYWPELMRTYYDTCALMYGWSADDSWEKLVEAKDRYCTFINECWKNRGECCDDVLRRVGWLQVYPIVQAVWLAMLGQIMTGQLFSGVRDLYLRADDSEPADDIDVLLAAGNRARQAMNHIDPEKESRRELLTRIRGTVSQGREAGLSFDELHELVEDVRLGRAAAR